ncbi:DNA helicase Pif1-like, partial [Kipferlia bialata]
VAAVNISGCTIHAFAGFGLGDGSVRELCTKIRRSKLAVQRWKDTRTLIVDEISMLDASLFEKLEAIARANRPPLAGCN